MADKTVIVRIALKAGGLTSGLGAASSAVRGFGTDVTREAGRAASATKALGLTSAVMGKMVILGIGGAMAVSAKAAIDFESSLAGVAKTTDLAGTAFDKANTPLKTFGDAIRNLSLDIPVNVNDLNKIAELGGQLGIEVPNLISFTDTIARLAVSTNLTIEEAATGLARIANIMGTPETEFERLGSVIVELGNNFATTEGEILSFSLRIAPVASALGSTEESVFGLSAALTSLGIPAERGGTAVQRVLTSMSQAVEQGGRDLKDWADVAGVSVDEFTEAFANDPIDAFALFVKGLDEINKSGGSLFGTLDQLGIKEQRTIQVLLAASGGYEQVADAINTARQEGEEVNALQIESARRFGTTASQLQLLGNSFNDLRIEIGGMLLGSGGLAAAIDILREFFAIIKANIDSVASMAQALALLAGVRLVMSLGGIVSKAFQAATALRGMATASTVLNFAMALSNVVLGAAAVGIGILMIKWANAAIKAAELAGRVRAFNDAIEAGQDPTDALVDSMKEANILTEARRQALHALGIGESAYIQTLLDGKDVFDLLSDSQKEALADAQALTSATGRTPGYKFLTDEQKNLLAFSNLLGDTQEDIDAIFIKRRNDLVEALIRSGQAVGMLDHDLEHLAEGGLLALGLGVSEEAFLAWASTGKQSLRAVGDAYLDFLNDLGGGRTESFWTAVTSRGPEGEQALEDWSDAITDSVEDMRTKLSETFTEIHDTMLGGMPTTDEYEQVARLTRAGLNRIIAAQDLYLIDLMDSVTASNAVMDGFSRATENWFATLDVPTQAAFGRLFETDPARFAAFMKEVEANFTEVGTVFQTRITAMLPDAMKEGFGGVVAMITSQTDLLELSGVQAIEALADGMEIAMVALSQQGLDDDFMAFLTESFGSPEAARKAGFDTTLPWVQGMIAALATLSEMAGPVITREVRDVMDKFNSEAQVDSPSKLTYYTGSMMGAGWIKGFEDSLYGWDPIVMKSQLQPKIESLVTPNVNLTTQAPVKNIQVHVHDSSKQSVGKNLQLAGIHASILSNTI